MTANEVGDWVGRLEKRVENAEREKASAQDFSKFETKVLDMIEKLATRVEKIETAAAVTVWKFALIAALGSVLLGAIVQVILKKSGLL